MPAEDTYQKILASARRLFITQGYTATSMRQLAQESGIGKATIYHHFPDKEALAMALLQLDLQVMDKALQLIRDEQDPHKRIRVAATASIEFLHKSMPLIQIIRREIPQGRDKMQLRYNTFLTELMKLLAEGIQRGMDSGEFRQTDARESARILMTMLQGNFAMVYLGGVQPQSPQQAIESLLDVFFHGIEA